jgi:hypothetical protein
MQWERTGCQAPTSLRTVAQGNETSMSPTRRTRLLPPGQREPC